MTGLVDEGRAVVIVCLDFSEALNTVCCKILIKKLMSLDEQTGLKTGSMVRPRVW